MFGKKKNNKNKDVGAKKQNKGKDKKGVAPQISESTKTFSNGVTDIKDIIAPESIYVDFNHLKIGNKYYRSIFVSGYPRYVGANWLSPIVTFEHPIEISMFYYPVESKGVLDDLRKKITEFQAQMSSDQQKGKIMDPTVSAALEDAKALQEKLVKGVERFFQFSFYITIPANSLEELDAMTKRVQGVLGSLLIVGKQTTLQMEQAFQSTLPLGVDKLVYVRNMDTSSIATTFPFTSSDLTMNQGVLYGINKHNGSLIIFDRFSMENANSVVFATSGAGKSYMVKLEILRSLMFGTECIAIDPEREYKALAESAGGEFVEFASGSESKINPFDIPTYQDGTDSEITENALGSKILSLHSLFKIIFGEMKNTEEAVLDKALLETYRLKGITEDPSTHVNEVPVMEDLYKVLLAMDETESKNLAARVERYVKGSLAGVFNQRTTVNLDNPFTVFSVRNLEDVLRPIAYYIILDFIWTKIKMNLKKRLLVVDEAWYLMTHPDSAYFMYSIAKRARKYFLGLTTISQDVSDFLNSEHGQVIVTNAAIKVLLKQSPSSIDKLSEVFHLSEGEKRLLLSVGVGEGLFFAGNNHVAMKVVASKKEDSIITTNPEQLLKMKQGLADSTESNVPGRKLPEDLKQEIQKEPEVNQNAVDNAKASANPANADVTQNSQVNQEQTQGKSIALE
jgi:type IV secretory pathway VirB4 component